MKLIAIAAMSANRVIGNGLQIPWKHSADMRHFKQTTTGHTVIMGRNTFESMGHRPLPNRRNIVLTRDSATSPGTIDKGAEAVTSVGLLAQYLYHQRGDRLNFVIGGAAIYKLLMPLTQEVLLTRINEEHPGDVFMPEFEDQFDGELQRTEGPLEFWRYVRRP